MIQKQNHHFRKFFHNFYVLFLTLFAILISVYVITSSVVYGSHSISFVYVLVVAGISLVLAILLSLFLSINNINQTIQIVAVYLCIMISMYAMGFITRVFRGSNIQFIIFTIGGNALADRKSVV